MNTNSKPSALAQLHFDIFITALEGGIKYWSEVTRLRWIQRDEFGVSLPGEPEDVYGFAATIVSPDGDWDGERTIDKAVVAAGYKLATTTWRKRLNWSSEAPPLVVTADTDWDCDAGDADMIVQLGLFGDVVYG